MSQYYNPSKLLSLRDLDGDVPEIYICTSNRTAGKTTAFNRYALKRFLNNEEKFCILVRFKYQLGNVAESFFKDINRLFFREYEMKDEPGGGGVFKNIFIRKIDTEEWINCGYAVSLNTANQIKNFSHYFSDVSRILMDEFLPEDGHYCSDELSKFQSVHTSISRGNGEMVRYVPVIMIGNTVTMFNPYYMEFGVTQRLMPETKFLRGNGYVLEQGYNDAAQKAQLSSTFNKAFKNSNYLKYSASANYLASDQSFIAKLSGANQYICTIKYQDHLYGVRYYKNECLLYANASADSSYYLKLSASLEDHSEGCRLDCPPNLKMLFRKKFDMGAFRFQDYSSKMAVLTLIM